jgi:hypothetical protein
VEDRGDDEERRRRRPARPSQPGWCPGWWHCLGVRGFRGCHNIIVAATFGIRNDETKAGISTCLLSKGNRARNPTIPGWLCLDGGQVEHARHDILGVVGQLGSFGMVDEPAEGGPVPALAAAVGGVMQ